MRKLLLAAALVAAPHMALGGVVQATGGDDYSCPPGTVHEYKLDNLSGPTFTVPTPPAGWTIIAVIIKAGPNHYTYSPVNPGQVLQVKTDTGHDVSHAHICKNEVQTSTTTTTTTTTSTPTESSTTSTSTTTPTTSTSTTSTSMESTTTTSSPSSTAASTTTVPGTTSTSSVLGTTTTSTEVAVGEPPIPTTTTTTPSRGTPTTSGPTRSTLPETGYNNEDAAFWATLAVCLGGCLWFVGRARRA